MRKDLFEAIDVQFEMVSDAFGGPVKEEEVDQAEQRLGVKLSGAYKEFVRRYGSGSVSEAIILGLREAEFVPTPSFVEESIHFRNQLPKDFSDIVVIGVDGAGNPIGFKSNESTIFIYDFDFGGRRDVAASFEDYVEKALNEQLDIQF